MGAMKLKIYNLVGDCGGNIVQISNVGAGVRAN
jgi:hypothetical protein